jgi:hypothetical protein
VMLTLQPFDESRWDDVLRFADSVAPFDPAGNREWLTNRQSFPDSGRERTQYAAFDKDGRMLAFGSAEQQPHRKTYRMFIVPSSVGLYPTAGDALFGRLMDDLVAMGAEDVFMQEWSLDVGATEFALAHGFQKVAEFSPEGVGPEMVKLWQRLALLKDSDWLTTAPL